MSKLDALIERARALSPEEQDALADYIADWLDAPTPPTGGGFPDGSEEELAARIEAWRATRMGVPAEELRAWLQAPRGALPRPQPRRIDP